MIRISSRASETEIEINRLIGEFHGNTEGAIAIFIAGLHGNEPTGIFAFERVLSRLKRIKPHFSGSIYGIAGNLEALTRGTRFIDYDLNRIWKRIISLNGVGKAHEQEEKQALVAILERILKSSNNPIFLFDLHTTSSESIPFIVLGDTLRNREIAKAIPVPMVLGLEEKMDGTMFNFLSDIGFSSLIFEGGQHDDPESINNHESFIWLILERLQMIDKHDVSGLNEHYRRLHEQTKNEGKVYEVRHRFHIHKGDEFKMNPHYRNFQRIKENESLAVCNGKEIYALESGKIFMPLYQEQGEDGFFIIRKIRKFWLRISRLMRILKLDRVLVVLPGVKKHKEQEHTYVINLKIARLFALQIFHLLGFRRERKEGNKLIVTRREYDLFAPDHRTLLNRFMILKGSVIS